MILLLSVGSMYLLPQTGVKNKVDVTINAISDIVNSNVRHKTQDASINVRLESWLAALQIFQDNPLIGVGWGHYQEHAKVLVENGLRHKFAAVFPHPHNQFLSSMVGGGVLGLIATLGLFLIPVLIFISVIRFLYESEVSRKFALAGLIMVVGFAVCNLTESFLERSRPVAFFLFYLAVCMAGIHQKKSSISYDEKFI